MKSFAQSSPIRTIFKSYPNFQHNDSSQNYLYTKMSDLLLLTNRPKRNTHTHPRHSLIRDRSQILRVRKRLGVSQLVERYSPSTKYYECRANFKLNDGSSPARLATAQCINTTAGGRNRHGVPVPV